MRYSDSLNYGIELPNGDLLYPNGRNHFENDGWTWKWNKEKVKWGLKNGFCEFTKKGDSYNIKYKVYLKVDNKGNQIEKSAPYKNLIKGILNTHATSELNKLFGRKLFDTPKPEKLLQTLITIGSNESDIVLDFFMGSATTQAVAMKMNRRFIGIEQMDYINTISVPRLQKVMEGEQGGISKDVDWQGGGSFVYAELMEKSKGYLDSVLQAENTDSLKQIYQLMLENVDLDFRADLEQVQEMLNDTISLEDKKRLLVKVIDKNQLYYNYSEIDDANVRELISDNDYAFNQSFYKEEEIDGQEDQ